MPTTIDVAATHDARAERITNLLATANDTRADWHGPSPCDGWTALDVLDHLVTTQAELLAEHGVEVPSVDVAVDQLAAWQAHTEAVVAQLGRDDVAGLAFEGWFGPTTLGATVDTFYGFDLLVHRWDLGRALGIDVRWSDEELDTIEAASAQFGPGLRMEGICGPPVELPAHSSRQDRLLGHLGRDPR